MQKRMSTKYLAAAAVFSLTLGLAACPGPGSTRNSAAEALAALLPADFDLAGLGEILADGSGTIRSSFDLPLSKNGITLNWTTDHPELVPKISADGKVQVLIPEASVPTLSKTSPLAPGPP
ncbi:MAG: hypothetical protein ACOYM2_20745 [Rectinemataceae bacterium]